MLPRQSPFSSKGFVDFGVQIGQYVVHRGPTEWMLDKIPDTLSAPLRKLVAKGFREIGKRTMLPETELQEAMNGKLFMNSVDAETGLPLLAEVDDHYLDTLFPHGKQEDWPSQLVICTKDVRPDPAAMRQTMLDFPEIASEVLGQPQQTVADFADNTAGKMVVVGVYNTDQDILHNAGAVLERTQEILHDPLSMKGVSPAAVKGGDTILRLMTLRQDGENIVLRDDAPDIMRHVMSHGYSQGGNIATDIFRHVRSELMSGRYALAQNASGSKTIDASQPDVVAGLMRNAYCYTIAAADVPYQDGDLNSMPPRDNSRSDGDLIISAAVGTARKQRNYQSSWQQDAPYLQRNDRLLESVGPAKRLFGLLEPRGTGYHSMLGHGDDAYRYSVVAEGGELLKERLAPRLLGQPMLADMTFAGDSVMLEFERGAPPARMASAVSSLQATLKAQGISAVPSRRNTGNPYRLELKATGDAATLAALNTGLEASGIARGEDMHIALNAPLVADWMERRLKKLPDTHIGIAATDAGPILQLRLPEGAGRHTQGLLTRGLERAGISPAKDTPSQEQRGAGHINIPLSEAVRAFKAYHTQGKGRGDAPAR